jgi:predicted aldo/keto reductase-like oxidoreductase
MNYRKFGTLDWEVSSLGLGVSRLPQADSLHVDQDEGVALIRAAIDWGINYIVLGTPYDMDRQERVCALVDLALQDGYRARVKVAATVPAFLIRSRPDLDRYLNEQLRWLEMDEIDFCLVGPLNRDNWPGLEEAGVLPWMERVMTDGRVNHMGFSFHDHFQILKKVMGAWDGWTFCQFQYSYMDVDHDPGVSGIKYAADQGLAVVVTESLKSGRLAKEPPNAVARTWAGATSDRSRAEWGLRFVLSHVEVSTVVSNMTTMEQVMADVAIAENAEPECISIQDELLISRVRDAYRKAKPIPCPSCRPCMPCPVGIDVPRVFEIYNDAIMYEDIDRARAIYRNERHHAGDCTACGVCEKRCAKRLPIPHWLELAQALLGAG